MNTERQVVLVSGGSRGLGQSIVQMFLDEGACVATFSRRRTAAVDAWEADAEVASRFYFTEADATDPHQCRDLVRETATRFGAPDVLVNNAGIARDGLLATFSDDDLDLLLNVDLKAVIQLTRTAVRQMLLKGSGRVMNISSIIGLRGYRGLSVYGAVKAGMDGFTRGLARELGPKQITVNSIAPGYLLTDMTHGLSDEQMQQIARRTPLGRLGCTDDVTALLKFLASDGAAFITGQTFVIDGGLTC